MAATITSKVILNDTEVYKVHLTNIYVDTAETAAVKIDLSGLVTELGTAPTSLTILNVQWVIQGYTYVKLLWDHTTDVTALLMTGVGSMDFGSIGLTDTGTGETGDICITTVGTTATSTYDILLTVRKEN